MSKENKHALSKAEELIPEMRFPEFEKDGEWELKSISSIAKVSAGGTPSSTEPKYWGGNIPWMNSGELNLKRVYSVENYITSLGLKESSTKMIPPLCVLIGLAGQGKTRGTAAINYIELCTNQSIAAIHPNKENFNSEFLYHKIDSMYKALRSLSTGQGGRGGLNLSIIREIEIPFPLIKEQQKIASCLSSLDDLIAAHSDKLETLKDHKKGLMQNLFPQKGQKVPNYRFPEFEKDGEWSEKEIGRIADNLDSRRVPITSNKREKGDIPYYGASGIIDYVNEYIFNEELLLISEDGANLIARVYPIAFSISGKSWVNNHAHVLKFEKWFTQVLVEKYLNSKNIEDFLTGMAQPKLNRQKLDLIPIPLPKSEEEQQKIASCLSSLDELITAQSEQIEQLQQHKKGLMQGLFPNTK